jgi:hypothetical protein
MRQILPALWSTPAKLSAEGVTVFNAIRNALKWASEIVRHVGLAQFCENDFYPYQRRMRDALTPLWKMVDLKTIPAETWDCAWAIREAVRPVSDDLSQLFMNANYPWSGSQKLKDLEFYRKRILEVRSKLAEEPLMRALCKAVCKEYPLVADGAAQRGQPLPATEGLVPKHDPKNRDNCIYHWMVEQKSLQWIKNRVNKRKSWEPLDTVQGVSLAGKRFATKHHLPWPVQR